MACPTRGCARVALLAQAEAFIFPGGVLSGRSAASLPRAVEASFCADLEGIIYSDKRISNIYPWKQPSRFFDPRPLIWHQHDQHNTAYTVHMRGIETQRCSLGAGCPPPHKLERAMKKKWMKSRGESILHIAKRVRLRQLLLRLHQRCCVTQHLCAQAKRNHCALAYTRLWSCFKLHLACILAFWNLYPVATMQFICRQVRFDVKLHAQQLWAARAKIFFSHIL